MCKAALSTNNDGIRWTTALRRATIIFCLRLHCSTLLMYIAEAHVANRVFPQDVRTWRLVFYTCVFPQDVRTYMAPGFLHTRFSPGRPYMVLGILHAVIFSGRTSVHGAFSFDYVCIFGRGHVKHRCGTLHSFRGPPKSGPRPVRS